MFHLEVWAPMAQWVR